MENKKGFGLTIIMTIVILSSCSRIKIQKPEGFAEIQKSTMYKAMSPEGLPFQVRSFKNYPKKDLSFWKKALKAHLQQEGYKLISEKTLGEESSEVHCFEWGAPYGGADYIYLTALMIKGKKILLAEAAGNMKLYNEHQHAIMKSLETLIIP